MKATFTNQIQPRKQTQLLKREKYLGIGFVLSAALMGALSGCVYPGPPAYVEVRTPPPNPPPPVYVESRPVVQVQDDYVYYPGYQVYYSGSRRQYVYLESGAWVTRPAPPRVSAEMLFASPSVRLDFHDAPALHHAEVARQYPPHWAPPGPKHGNPPGHDPRHDQPPQKGNPGRD